MEIVLDYDGAKFMGCVMLCFFMEHGCYWWIGFI